MTQTPEQVTVDRVSALLEAGRSEQALTLARQLASETPGDGTAQCALSAALMANGDAPGGQANAEAALAHDPDSAWGHQLLAEACVRQGFGSQALTAARRSVELAPDSSRGHEVLVHAAREAGQGPVADAASERLLQLAPEEGSAHHAAGLVALDNHEPERALEHFRMAISRNPSDAESHFFLGVALEQLHRDGDALRALKTAAELDPAAPGIADAIASMTRHEWLPMPGLARMFPFFLFPGLIVALFRRRSWRERERILPQLVAADAIRSRSRRESVRLVLLAIGCVASFACLAAFAGAVVLNAQWAYLTLGGSAVVLLAYQLVEVQVFR